MPRKNCHQEQASKFEYRGALATPMSYDCFLTERGGNRAVGDPTMLLSAKLDSLCRHYAVEPSEVNREHVLALAGRYVPGFQIGRAKGSRRRWDDIRLTQLWIYFREAQLKFSNDESTLGSIAEREDFQQITGDVKFAWLKQLLDKARLSPLVQMMESSNPCDNDFAHKFLSRHAGELVR